MKIFSWMKRKLNGKDNTIEPEPEPEPEPKPEPESMPYGMVCKPGKEEFTSCINPLLAIGTFGNGLKESNNSNITNSDDHIEETNSEVVEDELIRELLDKHISTDSCFSEESEMHNELIANESEEKESITSSVHGKGKNVPSNNRRNGMYRKSFSFLLKKARRLYKDSVLRSCIKSTEFPFPDSKLDGSRMEKILRTKLPTQKYLDMTETEQGEDSDENCDLTDSECK